VGLAGEFRLFLAGAFNDAAEEAGGAELVKDMAVGSDTVK
jgi:hypothetical protein